MSSDELAKKYSADSGDCISYTGPLYRFTEAGLAALIADVRMDEREKCAQECEAAAYGTTVKLVGIGFAEMLRARLEEGK